MNIKLAKWCENNNVSYITGYRWFKSGQIAGAFQTPTGTILIPADQKDMPKLTNITSDYKTLSTLMNKVVEFSSSKASIADFATYIMSNFQLIPLPLDQPVKVSEEENSDAAQQYIKQFMPDPEEKARIKSIKDSIKSTDPTVGLSIDEVSKLFESTEEVGEESITLEHKKWPFAPAQNIDWSTELDEDLIKSVQKVSGLMSGEHIFDKYQDLLKQELVEKDSDVIVHEALDTAPATTHIDYGAGSSPSDWFCRLPDPTAVQLVSDSDPDKFENAMFCRIDPEGTGELGVGNSPTATVQIPETKVVDKGRGKKSSKKETI